MPTPRFVRHGSPLHIALRQAVRSSAALAPPRQRLDPSSADAWLPPNLQQCSAGPQLYAEVLPSTLPLFPRDHTTPTPPPQSQRALIKSDHAASYLAPVVPRKHHQQELLSLRQSPPAPEALRPAFPAMLLHQTRPTASGLNILQRPALGPRASEILMSHIGACKSWDEMRDLFMAQKDNLAGVSASLYACHCMLHFHSCLMPHPAVILVPQLLMVPSPAAPHRPRLSSCPSCRSRPLVHMLLRPA